MKCKLGDYIRIKHGFAFKGEYITAENNGVVLVTPGNFEIGGGFKEDKCKFFNGDYPKEYVLSPYDLIVTMTDLSKQGDTLGYSALVPKTNRVYLHNQRIGLVDVYNPKADKMFIYWLMRTQKYQKTIVATSSGSTVKHTSPSRIYDVEVDLPPIDVQKKIAAILSALDEKIAINRAINDNLEAVLAASHSKMFFSKDTSEHSKLGELMTFGNGKSRPKTDGPIPVYGGNGVLSYTDHHNIENAVLIGRVGAYCGSVYLEQGICWVSDNAIFAKSKITKDEFFDYFLLKRLNLFNHHVGTGQQLLTQEILNNIEVPKPVTEQIELFNRKATSIFETIFTNSREIIRLQELSDLLLSRLAG